MSGEYANFAEHLVDVATDAHLQADEMTTEEYRESAGAAVAAVLRCLADAPDYLMPSDLLGLADEAEKRR